MANPTIKTKIEISCASQEEYDNIVAFFSDRGVTESTYATLGLDLYDERPSTLTVYYEHSAEWEGMCLCP